MIILTALDEAKHHVEEDIQDMQRRWATEEWSRAKKEFMESLGLRSQGWSAGGMGVGPNKSLALQQSAGITQGGTTTIQSLSSPAGASKSPYTQTSTAVTTSLSPFLSVHMP
eukprot:CAMPEP_0182435204 /NCGR_PEP_ID=MMETSP1167-20130531/74382_1 /TAXON_ID=2988 /ORGANISM="Mallomonas Sp, Strain CCMP3275" /LENGTH=111 /DNA_ID=CAMNT_0024625987 /DNA_START=98 /DNA_END=429 /DNA_ORIENTATION=-